jgi:[acyl-carrier-protein] S-malonyltransferase
MKCAFLFPGQGAQVVGMGADIAQTFAQAKEIFEKADQVVGFELSKICFEGPAEQLNTTAISQPAIFVTSVAILEVLRTTPPNSERVASSKPKALGMIQPDVTAGLSLGEYTALYAANILSFEDALTLVTKRGEAMQQAADATQGAMVSIIGFDEEKIRWLCEQASDSDLLVPVNFNCPGQIVVSGTKAACKRAKELAIKYGAIKAVRLDVAGAFHTEMMSSAAIALKKALQNCEFAEPANTKVISNINAQYYNNADEIRTGLEKQLTSPILWQKCMERLLADGIEEFYEIGPGKVLTGLMRRISRKTRIININNLQTLNEISRQII